MSPFGLYARVVVAATVLLIFVGALVTTKGAGLAVPDWPTTFDHNMFLVPLRYWAPGTGRGLNTRTA